MKIDSEQLLSTVHRFKNETVAKGDASSDTVQGAVSQGSDRVELSRNKEKIEQLKTMMQQMPDSHNEKVAQIRQQIADGTYQVDAREVAGSMLNRWRELHGK
jgi:negative regulator of flagellin synthesis FlgM